MYNCFSSIGDDKLHEECGVFGSVKTGEFGGSDPSFHRDPAYDAYNAMFALQHRGQDSCGIAAYVGNELRVHKAKGLVPDVFNHDNLRSFAGADCAIGHVRHASNVNDVNPANAQPIIAHHASGSLALCYNGKLSNSQALKTEMENRGAIFQTTNDAEVITYLIVREHLRTNTLEDAVLNAMEYLIGAFSVVLMSRNKLLAFRDTNGIRPLCMGKVGDSYVFASESCAIASLGGTFIRDVEPGELVSVYQGRVNSYHCNVRVAKRALCMFEMLYFARQDSVIDGASVGAVREAAGRLLAKHSTTKADVVIGVPDSGIAAALGFARESGIPYAMGLMKNRYIQRTFIQSYQIEREKNLRIKLNAMRAVVEGKRVIMVDDSIVRGLTSARQVHLLREAGAAEVHMKVTAPPFLYPCYYGTAIPKSEQLAAYGRSNEEICSFIGADSLQYMPVDGLNQLAESFGLTHCDACFTGHYHLPTSHW